MKSFIIAGASRSGKTTLARRLHEQTGLSLISADALICTFEWVFPDLKIAQAEHFDVTSTNFAKFLVPYIDHMVKFQNMPFIVDIYHLTPEQVIAHDLQKRYHVVFMGYPRITAAEKLQMIRQYKIGHYDWTDEHDDAYMLGSAAKMIAHSQKIEQAAQAAGLEFVDTGTDFEAQLDKTLKKLLAA